MTNTATNTTGRYRINPPTRPAQVERIDTVIRLVQQPGLVLVGPTEHTYVRHYLYPHHVIPAQTGEDTTTHELLDRGWLQRGDRDSVARHQPGDSASDPAPRTTATVVTICPAKRPEVERWWAEHYYGSNP